MSVQVRGYRPELDAVRFCAFILVFVHHFFVFSPRYLHWLYQGPAHADWLLRIALVESGSVGLCLFFALSAYLITDLLLEEKARFGRISIHQFYIRRILRIWPLYLFGIAIGFAFAAIEHRTADLNGLVWYLVLAGNIHCAIFGPLLNPMAPLWSISIEEQFYLLSPWVIARFGRRGVFVFAGVCLLCANFTLFLLGRHHTETDFAPWTNTFVQFEMFAGGALMAVFTRNRKWNRPGIGIPLTLAGPALWFLSCLCLHAKLPEIAGTAIGGSSLCLGYALFAVGCGCTLLGFCLIGGRCIPRWMSGLGRISYGLYVFHVLSLGLTELFLVGYGSKMYWVGRFCIGLLLTMTFAILSYEYLEKPFLRQKRRFERLHSRPI